MAGRTLTTEALVLGKGLPADSFQPFTLYSADEGVLRAYQRVSRRAAPTLAPLDLFDVAEVLLEASPQGNAWFVRESRVLEHHAGLGRTFDTLRLASAVATLVSGNPVHEESRAAVYRLLRNAFAAFSTSDRPDLVYLKSLYCFARDEGYPLRQQWLPGLSATDQALATAVLMQPVAGQTATPAAVARLQDKLETYLRGHTEIVLP